MSEAKQPSGTIRVLALEDEDPAVRERAFWSRKPAEVKLERTEVDAKQLKQRLDAFLNQMEEILANLPQKTAGLALDSVSFSVEVSAKGSVSLLGTGVEMAGKGGITFTLKKA